MTLHERSKKKPLGERVLAESESLHHANFTQSAEELQTAIAKCTQTLLIIEVATATVNVNAPTKGMKGNKKKLKFVWEVTPKIT